jgi:hypothetical protein
MQFIRRMKCEGAGERAASSVEARWTVAVDHEGHYAVLPTEDRDRLYMDNTRAVMTVPAAAIQMPRRNMLALFGYIQKEETAKKQSSVPNRIAYQ